MSVLTATVPGFGIKRFAAPQIVPHFGKHDTFYDLFCFSCSIIFAKEPCRQEVASELNPDVVNLLLCLQGESAAGFLFREMSIRLASEYWFNRAASRMKQEFNLKPDGWYSLDRASDFLLTSWQGPSGLAGTTAKPRFAKRNTASGGSTAARWRSVAESIPAWHERLRNVEFRNADALELIDDVPDREGVVVYSDSPYHPDARRGGKYAFDFTLEQHGILAEKLNRFRKTRIVVSHVRCPATDELYKGWRRVDLIAPRKMQNTIGGDSPSESANEVLYINDLRESV